MSIIVFLITLGFYVHNMAPALGTGDSAELAAAGASLGIAHSPGYPLYVLLTKCVSVMIPWASQAYRANFASALFSSGAAAVASITVTVLTGKKPFGFIMGLLLALSPTWLNQAHSAEVFALNTFFAATIFYFVIRYLLVPGSQPLVPAVCLLAFLLGLGLGNHHTLILIVPALAVCVVARFIGRRSAAPVPKGRERFASCKSGNYELCASVPLCLFFLLGLSVYLYIPIRSLQEPLLDWEDPQTWQRFVDLVTRARYGMFQIAQGSPNPLTLERIFSLTGYFVRTLYRNLGLPGSFLMLAALILACRERGRNNITVILVLVAGLLFTGPVFLFLANILPGPGPNFLLDRFMPLPVLFAGIILSAGISGAWEFLKRRITSGSATVITVVLAAIVLAPRTAEGLMVSKRFSYDLWHSIINVLRTLPDGAMLFADRADETEFSLAYLTATQNLKKNVKFVDCNAGVTRSIYGDDYYRIWGKPRLAIRQKVESGIVAEAKRQTRPVFYATVDTSQINIPRSREGILFRTVTGTNIKPGYWDWDELYLRNGPVAGFEEDTRLAAVELSNLRLLAYCFLDYGERVRAEAVYRNMASWGDGEWLVKLAYAYYERGYKPDAKKAYRSAIIRNPQSATAYSAFGSLCLEDGENAPAEHFLTKAVELAPDDVQINYNLAALYWRQRRWPEAAKLYERILNIAPNHADARKFLEQARRYL